MNPFLIIAALLILYSLKNYKQGFFLFLAFRLFLNNNINLINLPGVPLLTLEVFMSIFFALLCNQKKKIQPGNNDISPAVQQGIYLGTIVLCSIELYFDRRNPEYLHVTAIRCFLRFHQCLFMLDVNIKQRRYTESCQYIIRSLADNLHICIYRKIPGLQSRNGL